MRHRDIRTLRRQKRAPFSLQQQQHDHEADSQARMNAAFEQLERERAQHAQEQHQRARQA
jgi:hypothetical protein